MIKDSVTQLYNYTEDAQTRWCTIHGSVSLVVQVSVLNKNQIIHTIILYRPLLAAQMTICGILKNISEQFPL